MIPIVNKCSPYLFPSSPFGNERLSGYITGLVERYGNCQCAHDITRSPLLKILGFIATCANIGPNRYIVAIIEIKRYILLLQ